MEENISLIFNGDDPFSNISGFMELSDEELLGIDPESCSPDHLHNLLVDSPQQAGSAEIHCELDGEDQIELDLAMSFSRELYEREYGQIPSGSDPESTQKDRDRPSTSSTIADSVSPCISSMGASTSTSSDSGRESMGEEGEEIIRKKSVKMPEQSEEERKKSVLWKLMVDDEEQTRPKSPEVIDLTEMSDALPDSAVQQMRPIQQQAQHSLVQQPHPAQMQAPRMPNRIQQIPSSASCQIQFLQPSTAPQMQPPVIPRMTQPMLPPVASQGLIAPPPYALSMNPHVNQKLNSYMAFGQRNVRLDPSVIPRVDAGRSRRKKKEKRMETQTRTRRPYYVSSRAITDNDESSQRRMTSLQQPAHLRDAYCTPIYKKLRMMDQHGPMHPGNNPSVQSHHHLAIQSHASHQVQPYSPTQQSMQSHPMMPNPYNHPQHQPPACMRQRTTQQTPATPEYSQPMAQWPRHGDQSAHSQPPAKRPHPSPTAQQTMPPVSGKNPLASSPAHLQYSPTQLPPYPAYPNYAPYSGPPVMGPSYSAEWPVTSHSISVSQSPVAPDQSNYYYWDPYAAKPTTGTTATPPACLHQATTTVSPSAQDQLVPSSSPVISNSESAAGAEVRRQIEEELERVRKQAMDQKQAPVFVGSTDTTPSGSPRPQEDPVELQEAHNDEVVREVMRMIEGQRRPGYNARGHYSPEHKAMMARKVSSGSSSSPSESASTSAIETRKRPISTDDQPAEGVVVAQGNPLQEEGTLESPNRDEANQTDVEA